MERSTWRGTVQSALKKKGKKDDGGVGNKCAEVTGGQLHTMFTSLMDVPSGTDFSELGEDNEFTWNQFYVKVWGARDFELHTPMAMQNATGLAVPLTFLLIDSQLLVDLIANPKMLLNIRKVRGNDNIRVHCNNGVNIMLQNCQVQTNRDLQHHFNVKDDK